MFELLKYCDLHFHSTFSDGTYTPSYIASIAREKGFSALALTDHDTVDGLPEFFEACAANGLQPMTGMELTCQIGVREVHLLGYDFDMAHQRLCEELKVQQEHRAQRVQRMIEKLRGLNIDISLDQVMARAGKASLGRPHVALALVESGVVQTVDRAFAEYLVRGAPGFVDKPRLGVKEAIRLIREAGGIAVLAHPGIAHTDGAIPELVRAGLQGLEVWHSKHDESTVRKYLQMTERYKLLATGGSDCHGMTKQKQLLGLIKLPMERFQAIKEAARQTDQLVLFPASAGSGTECKKSPHLKNGDRQGQEKSRH